MSRWAAAAGAVILVCVVVWEQPAQAGGPLIVGGPSAAQGVLFVWSTAAPVSYHTDQGTLGTLTTAQADLLVRQGFDPWENLATASIAFSRTGDLGMDVTGANAVSFFNTLGNCSQPSTTTNAIVYDTDGSVIDAILGVGENRTVLGFASAICISSGGGNRITRGRAVMNGRFIDPQLPPVDLTSDKYQEVFVHEFGHLIGLDHSQVNVDVLAGQRDSDRLFGLPVMFPFLLGSTDARVTAGFPALAPDDEAWISFLYPAQPDFANSFGRINGRVFFSDGVTQVQGANVIARQVDDPGTTTVNESLRFAVSVVSGYKFTGNPGQSITGTNTGGSQFGSRDPTLSGFYEIPTRPGNYTVEVESIFEEFVEGSSVGPLGEQIPLPGPPEFFSQNESASDDQDVPQIVTVTPNGGPSDVNIILNGTLPRFDIFESARLWWREPAPAWLRERRPAALLVTG